MRRLTLLVILSAFLAGCNNPPPPSKPVEWEYKVWPAPARQAGFQGQESGQFSRDVLRIELEPETVLNELGAQGWELVGFNDSRRYVFKRPKR